MELSREQVLEESERELRLSNQKLLFKLSDYTEDDVDSENNGQEEEMLKEFRDEHATIAVDIQNMMIESEEILGETKMKLWDEVIADDQSKKIKHHAKDQS